MHKHFIIGGAQRSATTYLTRILQAHPQIEQAMPVRPEPKFFLKEDEFEEGYEGYLERYFANISDKEHFVLGEKSTSYIEYDIAAKRIKLLLPNARLIFLLRDPIERAISNINFSRMHDFEQAPLEQALLRELDAPDTVMSMDRAGISVSPQAYLGRSAYVDHLKVWFDIFPRDQIKILIKEKLTGNPEQVATVYEYLGVDSKFIPEILSETINASEKTELDEISPAVLKRLKDHFAEKNQALEKLCGLDLSIWS